MKPGEVVATRYRLEARLGVGGMGEVWRALHTGTGRAYALKFMHARVGDTQTARSRFGREARASARIGHPSVIDILDVGELDDGVMYLAMELLEGVNLAEALHLSPPLTVQDLLSVMIDTARALSAAHAVGIVHRDVKPQNIFLHVDKTTGLAAPKILDFGISKFGGVEESHNTATGTVLGSPRYMSPEQARSSSDVDHRTDLWACGVILFEGLTGTWPHEGESFTNLVVAICTEPPASIDRLAPGLPEALRAVVRDCLKPVAERIPSAEALGRRLEALVADPSYGRMRLPTPRHPPVDGVKASSGVRVRPPQLLTTGERQMVEGPMAAPRPLMPTRTDRVPVWTPPQGTGHLPPLPATPTLGMPYPAPPAVPTYPGQGFAQPDPLVGTGGRMSFSQGAEAPGHSPPPSHPSIPSLPSLPQMPRALPSRPPPAMSGGKAKAGAGRGLQVAAAVLSVMLVGIAVALVSMLSSGGSAPAAASSAAAVSTATSTAKPEAPPSATASAAPSAAVPPASASEGPSAAPPPAPLETASAAEAPAPPPAAKGKAPAARGKPKSKIDQLGSGL